jgi:hypothetical protein
MFFFGFAANLFTLLFLGIMSMVFLYQGVQGVIIADTNDEQKQIVLSHADISSNLNLPSFTELELQAYVSDEKLSVSEPPSKTLQIPDLIQELPVQSVNPFIGRGPPAA